MLRIKTLGGWGVTRADGSPREIPGQRVALLALLCAAGDRGISRDRIVALLWPDRPDDNARHSLGQSLYALRRDAESQDMVLGTTTLVLNPAVVSCDAWDLDAAARSGEHEHVAALYTGPFLSGVHVRGSAELQQLVDAEAARLAKLHADSIESLARTALARGDAAGSAAWWRQLASLDSYSSRVALELVRALAAAGDRVAALQAARVHEVLVREELQVEPDRAFAEFVAALRRDAAQIPVADAAESQARPDHDDERRRAFASSTVDAPRDTSTPNVSAPSGRPARARRWGARVAVAGAVSAVLLVGATRYFSTEADLDSARVYVAPFENRTGDATLDPLGGMTSDWVSQGLERSGVIAVASAVRAERPERTVTADAKPNADAVPVPSAAELATRLGAATVVSGTYYAVGDSLRFHVQISDVARGEVLDSFDATGAAAADPTVVMETVRQRTMGSLASLVDPRLRSWVRVASRPPTYQAYREFVTGQSLWSSDRRQALTHFLRAAALDSTFYAARVEIAILHRLLEECERTEAIARDLDRVRDRLAPYEYHVLDGQVAQCHGRWEESYREARAVADLRPRSAFLEYSVALQAMQLGRYGEARDLLSRHALEQGVAEVGPNYAIVFALVLSATHDTPRALATTRWLRARYPSFARAWGNETVMLARDGRVSDAEHLADTMTTLPLVPTAAVALGLRRAAAAVSVRGDTAAARRLLARALAYVNASGGKASATPAERAELLYELGRFDEARAMFTSLVAEDTASVDLRGYLGMIAARRGDASAALAVDAWLGGTRSPYTFTASLYRARIAALLDDRERSLALLSTGLDANGRFLLPAIREYGELASLRGDDRFQRLVTLR